MKKLEKEFTSLKFNFKQVMREKDYAIYERWYEDNEYNKHYEVIKIKSHNGYEIAGNKIPPSECYPGSNSWGTDGFTCVTKEAAIKRLDRMIKEDAANKERMLKKLNK